ncbi:MAG TPA: sulfite exporter TauE/SafE family protein, partial [Acidimicrobiales bacterium]
PIVAVAAPLPATVPGTAVASLAYWRHRLVDRTVVLWSLAVGVPATALGALASRWVDGHALLVVSEVMIIAIGARSLAGRQRAATPSAPNYSKARLVAVAALTGLAAGLLANSGGFLLAPLYIAVLRLPIKQAFACSLVVSAVLAVPGTMVHATLGHIDWRIVALFGIASVPASYLGARVAIQADAGRLERAYGAALVALGGALLILR